MVDLKAKFSATGAPEVLNSAFPLPSANWEEAVAARLREAVRHAGGNKAVSDRSGVPTRTISAYLAGQDMKLSTVLSLAAACGISIDWLVTGRETAPPAAPAPSAPPALFSIVDMDLLASAIDGATAAFAARGAEPKGRAYAQIICLLYDEARNRMEKPNP
jgi:hypothetical protein